MSNIKIVAKSIGKRGLVPTLAMIWNEYAFDSKYGIKTRGRQKQNVNEIRGSNSDNGKEYQGYNYYFFKKFMKQLPIDYFQSVFVDFGSGKGRVLIMASEYNFKKVVGIEYAEDLFKESIANIRTAKIEANNIEVVHGDAVSYSIPDDANVLFFFNPFDERVMEIVLKNVDESKRKFPRDLYIVYTSPMFEACFNNRGYEKVFELKNGKKIEGIIYRV